VAIPINQAGTVTADGKQVVMQCPYQFRSVAVVLWASFGMVTLRASTMMRAELS